MKFHVSERLRLNISKKYLDWAEALPKFGGGPVAMLQTIRERQRKETERVYERSRPPEGTEISFLYYRMFEMFHLKDFGSFQKSLIRFMPDLSDRAHRTTSEALARMSQGDSVSYVNIGAITRKSANMGGVRHEDPQLPNHVSLIRLGVRRVLPSLFVIALDVHLTEEAAAELVRLQSSRYLPDISLTNLFPRSVYHFGYSSNGAEAVQSREINRWAEELRQKVEKYLKPILIGGVFSRQEHLRVKLPAVEVFAIRGVSGEDEVFEEWKEQARGWYESLGFDFLFDTYKHNEYVLEFPSPWMRGIISSQARIVVLQESFAQTEQLDPYGGDVLWAIRHHAEYVLNDATPFIVIFAFLTVAWNDFEKLRKLAFEKMTTRPSLRQSIRLNEEIYHEKALIGVISQEFGFWKKRLGSSDSDVFKNLEYAGPRRRGVQGDLKDNLSAAVKSRIERLEQHLSNIEESFSNYLALRHTEAIYRLQRTAALAATLAVVIALTTLDWSKLLDTVRSLFD